MTNILITGAAGNLGSLLSKYLRDHEKEKSSALDIPDFFSIEQRDKRVIDARHKFARKRYFDKHRWEPTDQIVTVIAETIFGKLI
jgi:nucleoside-diphosphate-sugar epimerase